MQDMIQAFKFRAVGKFLLDSLVKSQLYFPSPQQLNDPFDCQIKIDTALQRVITTVPKEQRDELSEIVTELREFLIQYQHDAQ